MEKTRAFQNVHDAAPAPTPFLGRAQDIAEIGAQLADPLCRLLTLTGPGGIGKTRLAREIASHHQALFPDGIFWVSLAHLSRIDDLLPAIAEATPFCFQQESRSPREQFFLYLREKQAQQVLLVLDNVEHLLDGIDLIADILVATSSWKILATSREVLNLQEEWVRPITGLTYPEQAKGKVAGEYSAVQVFVERARRVRHDFALTEDEQGVRDICRLVEGMPLALELAAGWLGTLRPADIALEIQRNLDLLATRAHNLPERHRSIRSVFASSWQLLPEMDREVFQKLSVFRCGWTREAAESVAGASLPTLARLIDQSLVRRNTLGGYEVHELLRQYGAEHLEAAGLTEAVQQRYLNYYLKLLARYERDIKAHYQRSALDAIAFDFENVRHAWHLAVRQKHVVALGEALESLHLFADMRERSHDIVPLFQEAVEQFPPFPTEKQRAILHHLQARLIRLIVLGNLRIERHLRAEIDDCLAAARARQDQAEIGFCLMVSGLVARCEADEAPPDTDTRASRLFQESAAVYSALGDLFYQAEALAWQATTTTREAVQVSQALLQQSLALRREIEDCHGIAWITLSLTDVMLARLDYFACERYAREGLVLMREMGNVKGILHALFELTEMVLFKGELEEARALAEEMRDLADKTNDLNSKMLSAGVLALLLCVVDEAYMEGAMLAREQQMLAQEPFYGGRHELSARWGQAVADCGLGEYAAARSSYSACFEGRRGDPGPATICLALEAAVLTHHGMWEAATELLGLAFRQPGWASGWLHRWPLIARLRTALRGKLDEEAYRVAWERGAAQDLETTIRSILGEAGEPSHKQANHALLEPLSEREREVLGLIAQGMSNQAIARRLVLTVNTVKVHTRNIYGKLGVNSRTQALAQATRFKLL